MGRTMTQESSDKTKAGPELPGMFARYKNLVEQELARSVPSSDDAELHVLLRYHLGWVDRHGKAAETPVSQGKALRPTLCLFACEALSRDTARAQPGAAALELIHNFSLVHDDIQDQDRERRHQPTVWSLWGIPRALVAGNAMQSVGDLALLGVVRRDVPPETVLKVSEILTSSYLEMIEGQCQDMAFESRSDITTEEYLRMIALKTGALIRSGLEIGALLAGGGSTAVEAFSRFGSYLGRAFQIRDDFLGIWGDEVTIGKASGNDIRRRKKSFPVVCAFSQASGPARDDLIRIYQQKELDEGDVQRVLDVLDEVGAREQSQQVTEASAAAAFQALDSIPLPPWAKTEAEELVDFLARREY
jgi:geranylgeranyl diphosphate synthase type I